MMVRDDRRRPRLRSERQRRHPAPRRTLARLLAGLSVVGLAGCTDPWYGARYWTATGTNAANLAAMAEQPEDLAQGRGMSGADGALAVTAIDQLLSGHRPALSGAATSDAGSGGSSGSSAGSSGAGSGSSGGTN